MIFFNRAKRGLVFVQSGQKRACFYSIRPKEGSILSALLPEENELSGTRTIGRDLDLQPGRRVPGKEGSTYRSA